MTIKAIIFDLDGTLIDSMGLWRMVDSEFLNTRGIDVPEDLFDHLPGGNSFIQTAQYFKDRFALKETTSEIMQIWTAMVTEHYAKSVPLKDGVSQLLERLAASGLKLGLATSNSFELAQTSLRYNGVWHFFEHASTGDMHLMGKPFPDIFLHCAKGLGVEPYECIAIEDTLSGVQAAKAAGMHTLAIYDADSIRQHEQIKAAADAFCADYAAITQEIMKLREDI
jgi:HAD superfamily hydrolase (TIGR01509 family)